MVNLWDDWYWLQPDGAIVPAKGPMQDIDVRRVGYDEWKFPSEISVSTVFLGLNHGYPRGEEPPILFETMVFWGGHELDNDGERYATLDEAKAGHARWVSTVRDAITKRMEPYA